MTLLTAPYNNAMRLGQGFNSYTQKICVDDAVVVSAHRPENFLTNDGQTMRTLAEHRSQPSLWRHGKEVLVDQDRLQEAHTASDAWINPKYTELTEKREELIRAIKRLEEKPSATIGMEENPTPPPPYPDHVASPIYKASTRTWRIKNIGGPSQTVVFTSRFVKDLSQVTKDMGISASLSIKAGMVAGSGRGSFIDSDKFLNSDLNLYVSCKVVNQTINFKDPLEFNPLPDGVVDQDRWLEVYGDCYISAFLEGGEFQALVSMKVLNQAKMTEIEAAAKVAFSSGALDVEASAAFKLAKANINLNTETTITASWSGGGNIKPPNEPWTVESLMRAASRFPQNVANSPQRTHAVLQKYDHLRSYIAQLPEKLSTFNYDNASLYTDELMDYFMVYKALTTNLTADIREIQQGTKRFRPSQPEKEGPVYEASIDGLEQALQDIRPQLSRIVARVDYIERHPEVVAKKSNRNFKDDFLSPVQFWDKLPIIESVRTGQASRPPLTGLQIGPDPNKKEPQRAAGQDKANEALMANFCEREPAGLSLTVVEERKFLAKVEADKPNAFPPVSASAEKAKKASAASCKMRLTRPVGSRENGEAFFGFDFIRSYVGISSLSVGVALGAIASISVSYRNGLQFRRGRADEEQDLFALRDFEEDEVILNGSIEYGKPEDGKTKGAGAVTVTALKLFTSKGRSLHAAAANQIRYGYQCRFLDERVFSDLEEVQFEAPLPRAVLVGFYGASEEKGETPGVHRLGFVWAVPPTKVVTPTESNEPVTSIEHFATPTEPLVGLQHAPLAVDKDFESCLLASERAVILSPAGKVKYHGLRFGPCLGTDRTPVQGTTLFNTPDVLSAIVGSGKTEFPTQLSFVFVRSPVARLVGVRVWYGKVGLVHGAEADEDGGSNVVSLDVKLAQGEAVRSFMVQQAEETWGNVQAGEVGLPSGLAVTTSRGRTIALDAISGSQSLSGGREVTGLPGTFGLKGFFGFETQNGLSRLLPIWG